jgi:hypothetical protein
VYADDYLAALTIQDAGAAGLACLQRERWRTWVAELNGAIVAYATAGPWSEDRAGGIAEIDDLYVDPVDAPRAPRPRRQHPSDAG